VACEGELKVEVTGLIDRHVAIHVLPVGATPPTADTRQAYRPNWNPDTYRMYSFRTITSQDISSSRAWLVYLVRTGNPRINGQSRPVNFNVQVDENCGRYPLASASAPRQAVVSSPRSGDTQQGGVDVATYCRALHPYYIPRTVNNQYWVCYDPVVDRAAFTVETSDFNAMCVNTYGRGAYMVKQANQTTGGNCYR
jgi:hypothetical protein